MATNPRVPQGTLNLLRGSMSVTDNPALNITAPFLTKDMFNVTFEGAFTGQLPTATSFVNSPEPYIMVKVTADILKTNGLAAAYITQAQDNCVLGDCTFKFDSSSMPDLELFNTSIVSVHDIKVNGSTAGVQIVLSGGSYINSSLWDLV